MPGAPRSSSVLSHRDDVREARRRPRIAKSLAAARIAGGRDHRRASSTRWHDPRGVRKGQSRVTPRASCRRSKGCFIRSCGRHADALDPDGPFAPMLDAMQAHTVALLKHAKGRKLVRRRRDQAVEHLEQFVDEQDRVVPARRATRVRAGSRSEDPRDLRAPTPRMSHGKPMAAATGRARISSSAACQGQPILSAHHHDRAVDGTGQRTEVDRSRLSTSPATVNEK